MEEEHISCIGKCLSFTSEFLLFLCTPTLVTLNKTIHLNRNKYQKQLKPNLFLRNWNINNSHTVLVRLLWQGVRQLEERNTCQTKTLMIL